MERHLGLFERVDPLRLHMLIKDPNFQAWIALTQVIENINRLKIN
jgi:hypothetical protein